MLAADFSRGYNAHADFADLPGAAGVGGVALGASRDAAPRRADLACRALVPGVAVAAGAALPGAVAHEAVGARDVGAAFRAQAANALNSVRAGDSGAAEAALAARTDEAVGARRVTRARRADPVRADLAIGARLVRARTTNAVPERRPA